MNKLEISTKINLDKNSMSYNDFVRLIVARGESSSIEMVNSFFSRLFLCNNSFFEELIQKFGRPLIDLHRKVSPVNFDGMCDMADYLAREIYLEYKKESIDKEEINRTLEVLKVISQASAESFLYYRKNSVRCSELVDDFNDCITLLRLKNVDTIFFGKIYYITDKTFENVNTPTFKLVNKYLNSLFFV